MGTGGKFLKEVQVYFDLSSGHRALTIASVLIGVVLFPRGALTQEVEAGQGACKLGAQVIDRRNQSGVVVEAKGSDCRVRHADGSVHYYLAWMLSPAAVEGARSKGSGGLSVGSYHCVAAAGVAGTLRLVIRSMTQYADRNGTTGRYSFDPQTRKIVFESGPWAGYYGAQLGPGKIGLSSRPGNYYGTSCDLK